MKGSDAKQTVLSGLSKLKITTSCRPKDAVYEQYILQEYLVYRAYAALTDASFRTRLLHITYRDCAGKVAPITTMGFFLERRRRPRDPPRAEGAAGEGCTVRRLDAGRR